MKNIMIIDMQKGFVNNNNYHIVEKIFNYIESEKFDNIFCTRCINNPNSPFVKFLNYEAMCTEDEQRLVIDIKKEKTVITKTGYGIGNKAIEELKEKNITEIELCGTDTDACVLAIAFELFDNGIKPIILQNLCASSSSNMEMHNMAIRIIERQFGKNNIKTVQI